MVLIAGISDTGSALKLRTTSLTIATAITFDGTLVTPPTVSMVTSLLNDPSKVNVIKVDLAASTSDPAAIAAFQAMASTTIISYFPTSAPSSQPSYSPTATPTGTPNSSPSSPPVNAPGGSSSGSSSCFAGSEQVQLFDGTSVKLSDVRLGDRILSATRDGELSFADVIAIPHAKNHIEVQFISIITASNVALQLTPDHLLLGNDCLSSIPLLISAANVREGQCLQTTRGCDPIVSKEKKKGRGIYTVVTTNEFIVVNGVVASPFAVNHAIANAFYDVYRAIYSLAPCALRGYLFQAGSSAFSEAVFLVSL